MGGLLKFCFTCLSGLGFEVKGSLGVSALGLPDTGSGFRFTVPK